MSGVRETAETTEEGLAPPELQGNEVEARARRMGWVPREEFRGASERWTSAEDFIRAAEERMPVLLERNRVLDRKLEAANQQTAAVLEIVQEMRTASAKAEQRMYDKAKAELLAQQRQAVASADTATFQQTARELEQLEKEKPAAPPPAPAKPAAQVPGEVKEWVDRQPWWNKNKVATQTAVALHGTLLAEHPHWSMDENLREVEARVRRAFPEEFQQTAPEPNARRDAPPAVASGGAAAPVRNTGAPKKISDLPRDEQPAARAAFTRWQKQIPGYTEEEYVAAYGA